MTSRFSIAFEVELLVAEGSTQFLIRGLWIIIGETAFQQLMNLWQRPPTGLLCGFRLAEGLANHLHQVVQLLIRLVFLDQRGDFRIIQPVMLALIKQMEHLRKELFVIEVVPKIDILPRGNAHADKTSRTCRIHHGFC